MKRVSLLVMLALIISLFSVAHAYSNDLTRDEYEAFYEIVEYMSEVEWNVPFDDILDTLAYEYGLDSDDMYDFLVFAVAADTDHVWYPINGGKKYHAKPDCSKMVDPRPATKEIAWGFGFEPCGRCKLGW